MKTILIVLLMLVFAALSEAPTHSVQVVLTFDKMSIEQLADFEKDILKKYPGVKVTITVDPPSASSGSFIFLRNFQRWGGQDNQYLLDYSKTVTPCTDSTAFGDMDSTTYILNKKFERIE